MISFSIDKQRGKVNAERMSRPVDSFKNKTKNQPLVLALTSTEQSPTFASRLKRKLLSGPILGGAYKNFGQPAIADNEIFDEDYSEKETWDDIKADSTSVKFGYLVAEEAIGHIAYSKSLKKVVIIFSCC